MDEKIYTIPVNEAFDKKDGCPFCRMRRKLEDDERELIMGASMMDPDIRIKTNKSGFCKRHYEKMLSMNNKLSLALMLQSHLDEVGQKTLIWKNSLLGKDNTKKASENIRELKKSCYICERVDEKFEKMVICGVILWSSDTNFKEKMKNQQYFCLEHAELFLESARIKLDKKSFSAFAEQLSCVQSTYLATLKDDIALFCKKFDYRYENEPWGNSKTSVERAVKYLEGDY